MKNAEQCNLSLYIFQPFPLQFDWNLFSLKIFCFPWTAKNPRDYEDSSGSTLTVAFHYFNENEIFHNRGRDNGAILPSSRSTIAFLFLFFFLSPFAIPLDEQRRERKYRQIFERGRRTCIYELAGYEAAEET